MLGVPHTAIIHVDGSFVHVEWNAPAPTKCHMVVYDSEGVAKVVHLLTRIEKRRIADLESQVEALQDANERLRAAAMFGITVLQTARENLGCDVDGGDIQEWAQAAGLLADVPVTEPCGDDCSCADYSDFPTSCLRYSPDALALIRERA